LVLVTAVVTAAAGIVAIVLVIRHYFAPERIVANASSAFEELVGAQLWVGRPELNLAKGLLTLHDVVVRVPPEKLTIRKEFDPSDAILVKADALRIAFRRKGILGTRLRLREIAIDGPQFNLTQSGGTYWNWQLLFEGSNTTVGETRGFGVGPPIRLRQGRLTFTEIINGERLNRGTVHFSAEAIPHGDRYRIDLATWTDQAKGPKASIDFDPRAGRVLAGSMPMIDWQNVQLTIPEPYSGWCKRFGLAGRIAISEMKYASDDETRFVLVLREVRAKIPLSSTEWNDPEGEWFLNFTDLAGRIEFLADRVRIDKLTGKLNGADCELTGVYKGYSSNVAETGFDLHVKARGFVSPDYNDPADQEMIETRLPRKLRNCFHDFKPRGKFNFDLQIAKSPGAQAAVTISGKVNPDHISAEYFKFPYRVDDVTGEVVLADGGFVITGLNGYSDGRRMELTGSVSEPSGQARIEIEITAEQANLDDKLYRALPDRYQRIWRMFRPAGRARADIRLFRSPGPTGKWDRRISAELINACGRYEKFPYQLDQVSGRLIMANEELKLVGLKGRHGSALVTINGQVSNLNTAKPTINLQLEAEKVDIDDDLLAALPADRAQIIRDCRLSGTGRMSGSMKVVPDRPWDYKFVCDLQNGYACYKDFPYPLEDLQGRVVITPGGIEIEGVFSRKRSRTIKAGGHLKFGKGGEQIQLSIDADNVPIDSRLYQALDARQRAIWHALSPAGRIDAHAELSRLGDQPWKWNLTATLDKASMRYGKLPKLTDIVGKVKFASDQTSLEDIRAKSEGGSTVQCAGKITTKGDTVYAQMRLGLEKLPITKELIDQVGAKRLTTVLKWTPAGVMNCRLDQLEVKVPTKQRGYQEWKLTGKIDCAEAKMAAFSQKPVNLKFDGTMQWTSPGEEFGLSGKAALSTFTWKNCTVNDISCRLAKKLGDQSLKLTALKGKIGPGLIGGAAQFHILPSKTVYGMQLGLEDVPVERVIPSDKIKSGPIRGRMRGDLYLVGDLGGKYVRRGEGQIWISAAQALKVPLFASIYQIVRDEPANLASFHDVTAKFTLQQHNMDLQEIELLGETLSMLGYGRINLSNNRIKLHLITAAPRQLITLPILKDLVERATVDLTEVQVSGTLARPVIKPTPLRELSDTLKSFLEGKRSYQPPARKFLKD